MALVKKSTWMSLRHSVNNYVSDFTSGVSDVLSSMADPINDSINEGLRDDIPADETELERLEREREELEEQQRQQEEDELLAQQEQEEQERQWQEEYQAQLDYEAANAGPSVLERAYDAVKGSALYQGYRSARNLAIGGALVGAGLGVTAGTAGLAFSAVPAAVGTAADIVSWAKEKFERDTREQEKANEKKKLAEAEAQAANGVPEDQRDAKAEIGTTAYNNIKAKEKTNDQKRIQQDELEAPGAKDAEKQPSAKVDPDYIKQTTDELMARIQKEPENAFDFERV